MSVHPNLSPDGRRIAFLSVPDNRSPWVYTLVVLDLSTRKVLATIVPQSGPRSLSRPFFVDEDHLKYVERREDEKSYNLWTYDVTTQHRELVSTGLDADIEKAVPFMVGE